MNKEHFVDEIIMVMARHIDKNCLEILRQTLVEKLHGVELEAPQLPATYQQSNAYLVDMFKTFKGNTCSAKTMKMYLYTLEKFQSRVNKPFLDVSAMDVEYFLSTMPGTEVTLNNYRRNLSAFYTWLRKKHIVNINPVEDIEAYKEVKKPIDHMKQEELEQLKEGCTDKRDRALIEFLRCTGVRVGELISVKISDIDFKEGKVLVYGEKTKKYRYVYLDAVAQNYILKYIEERGLDTKSNEPLIASERGGGHISDSAIRAILNRIQKDSKLDINVYPHLFRKTVASMIVRRGGTVIDAGDYLGHEDTTVAGKHYAFKGEDHIYKIFEKYVAIA